MKIHIHIHDADLKPGEHWVTTKTGTPILIGKDGEVKAGAGGALTFKAGEKAFHHAGGRVREGEISRDFGDEKIGFIRSHEHGSDRHLKFPSLLESYPVERGDLFSTPEDAQKELDRVNEERKKKRILEEYKSAQPPNKKQLASIAEDRHKDVSGIYKESTPIHDMKSRKLKLKAIKAKEKVIKELNKTAVGFANKNIDKVYATWAKNEEASTMMNEILRDKSATPDTDGYEEVHAAASFISGLQNLFSFGPASTMYRGMSVDDPEKMVGKTITDSGFSALSLDDEHAMNFAYGEEDGRGKKGVLLHVRVPEGQKGLPITCLKKLADVGDDVMDEYEMLLPRNSKIKVLSVRKRLDGKYEADAEIVK